MILTFTFKSPEAIRSALEDVDINPDIDEVPSELQELLDFWFEYGEYVRVQLDTETGQATVLSNSRRR